LDGDKGVINSRIPKFASYILFSNHRLLSTTIVSFTAAAETQMLRIVSTVSRPSSTGILGKAANTGVCWGRLLPNHVVDRNPQADVPSRLLQYAMQI